MHLSSCNRGLIWLSMLLGLGNGAALADKTAAWQLGGAGDDLINDLAVNPRGQLVVVGAFSETADLDPSTGTTPASSQGGTDAFIVRLDNTGAYLGSSTIGGKSDDTIHAVTCDERGNFYITGYFTNTVDFNPGPGTAELQALGGKDVFVAKYTANGDYQWAFNIGSTSDDAGIDLALTTGGELFVCGTVGGDVDLDPGIGVDHQRGRGLSDAFIIHCTANGKFQWGLLLGSIEEDAACAVVALPSGEVAVAGEFSRSIQFHPLLPRELQNSHGSRDLFLAQYSATGRPRWVSTVGSLADDRLAHGGLALSSAGNLFLAGQIGSNAKIEHGDRSPLRVKTNGQSDGLLACFDSHGQPRWAANIGGSGPDVAHDVALGPNDAVYVVGSFTAKADFAPGEGTAQLDANTDDSVSSGFVACYGANGTYRWSTAIGGSQPDPASSLPGPPGTIALAIAIDREDQIWTAGRFVNKLVLIGSPQLTSAGRSDGFVVRLPTTTPGQ